MTLELLQSLFIFTAIFTGGALFGLALTVSNRGPSEFVCRAGKHWFASDRPCPVCIADMVREYNEATDTKSDGDE